MYITEYLFGIFSEFIVRTGGEEISGKKSKMSPDIVFMWRGDLFFGYLKGKGYEVFGMAVEDLEREWEGFKERLAQADRESSKESNSSE